MQFNPDAFKIASFDSVNLPLLKYVASKQKPIILSTGMCGMSEIEDALNATRAAIAIPLNNAILENDENKRSALANYWGVKTTIK